MSDDAQRRAIWRLERLLADERTYSVKATKQLHRTMSRDLAEAEQRAKRAERRAKKADQRAVALQRRLAEVEAELDAVRASATWKAGRAVVAVPAKLKRWKAHR